MKKYNEISDCGLKVDFTVAELEKLKVPDKNELEWKRRSVFQMYL